MSALHRAMALESIRTQLKIVSCLPRHGRLAAGRAGFSIEREIPLYTAASRYLRGESRATMLQGLGDLISAACEKGQDLLASRYLVDMHVDSEREALVRASLRDLAEDLAGAARGLDLLVNSTYSQDAAACSELQVLQAKAAATVQQIRAIL